MQPSILLLAKPGCGGKSSENITYLDSSSAKLSTYPGACTYSICPKSADICRIRFDFEVNMKNNYHFKLG